MSLMLILLLHEAPLSVDQHFDLLTKLEHLNTPSCPSCQTCRSFSEVKDAFTDNSVLDQDSFNTLLKTWIDKNIFCKLRNIWSSSLYFLIIKRQNVIIHCWLLDGILVWVYESFSVSFKCLPFSAKSVFCWNLWEGKVL